MNATVAASLASQLPEFKRTVDAPIGQLAYGVDLSCITDLDPYLAEVDHESTEAIMQAVLRRYITPRGALLDDDDYGLDIRAHLSRGVTQQDLRAIAGALTGEAQKDDRVGAAEVSLVAASRASRTQVQVMITPADPARQDFDFTFAVTGGDVLTGTIA